MPERAPPRVLFVCVHNAGRSQIAAAFLKHMARGRVEVSSGGTEPADAIHPEVLAAMREEGIDLWRTRPRKLEDASGGHPDVVVTMGCGDACPVYPGARYQDWAVADPAGRPLEEVRAIRDDIRGRVDALVAELL